MKPEAKLSPPPPGRKMIADTALVAALRLPPANLRSPYRTEDKSLVQAKVISSSRQAGQEYCLALHAGAGTFH